jgi:hypothetical protein
MWNTIKIYHQICIVQGHTWNKYTYVGICIKYMLDLGLPISYNVIYEKKNPNLYVHYICIYVYMVIMHVDNWHPPIYPINIGLDIWCQSCWILKKIIIENSIKIKIKKLGKLEHDLILVESSQWVMFYLICGRYCILRNSCH